MRCFLVFFLVCCFLWGKSSAQANAPKLHQQIRLVLGAHSSLQQSRRHSAWHGAGGSHASFQYLRSFALIFGRFIRSGTCAKRAPHVTENIQQGTKTRNKNQERALNVIDAPPFIF